MNTGYACINLTLAGQNIKVNKSMVKRTFTNKGLSYASEIATKNIKALDQVIDWNIEHDIKLYRMSSDMFPWMSEYELPDLPDYSSIKSILERVGKKAKYHKLRLTYHPGPFNVLATSNERVLQNTLKELRQHGEVMDMIGLPISPYANIHVGGAYGNKEAAIKRFAENCSKLPFSARSRLTVENDDRANLFSIKDLQEIHFLTGIPLVFDYLHHTFCTGGLSEEEAMLMAYGTWPENIKPVVHYSSSKKLF
ncbi:UV DNA damage repair endonuclease UvsE [Cytophagaceae bacterium ABcell3]|nr:UV DNA damage repair endonuclease UvsE [Cytophagaceae bacterium ABcell3]